MKTVYLIRAPGTEQGTLGTVIAPGFSCRSIELPWRGNRRNVSRIPPGDYRVTWHRSPKYGGVYWVRGIPGRSGVLIHPGNLAGDLSRGWKTHSKGCLLFGKYAGRLQGQTAVLSSRPTVRSFSRAMGQKDFILKVREV